MKNKIIPLVDNQKLSDEEIRSRNKKNQTWELFYPDGTSSLMTYDPIEHEKDKMENKKIKPLNRKMFELDDWDGFVKRDEVMSLLKTSTRNLKEELEEEFEGWSFVLDRINKILERYAGEMKLNLGCGGDIKKGYINVDFEEVEGVDRIFDLNKFPYPINDNQAEEILMYNILEHLDNPYKVMQEIYRISKPKAKIEIYVPHFSSNDTWGDIQHKRGFSSGTFKVDNISCMFKLVKQKIKFSRYGFLPELFANRFPKIYEKFFAYIVPASYLYIHLEKE